MVAVEAAAPWAAERAMMLEVEDAGVLLLRAMGGTRERSLFSKVSAADITACVEGYTRGGAPSGTHPLAPPNVMAGARIMRPSTRSWRSIFRAIFQITKSLPDLSPNPGARA